MLLQCSYVLHYRHTALDRCHDSGLEFQLILNFKITTLTNVSDYYSKIKKNNHRFLPPERPFWDYNPHEEKTNTYLKLHAHTQALYFFCISSFFVCSPTQMKCRQICKQKYRKCSQSIPRKTNSVRLKTNVFVAFETDCCHVFVFTACCYRSFPQFLPTQLDVAA